MLTKESFSELLAQGPCLLDGATGSYLRARGMPRDCATEEWVLRNPEVLVELQRGYAQAGSRIIYAPTFQAQPIALRKIGLENHTETELEYVLIDPETAGVDAAHPRKLKLQDGKIPYTRTLFDEDALIFDNTQVERVGVEVDGKPYVTLTCKGFPSVGVWSKPKADAPFVCLEPWIGRCDNVGFDGELKDKYGEQHLKAGETFQAGYTITIGE